MVEQNNKAPFGFLNIYKPKGMTSHDVVARLRKILGIKQIGHTGTLDPFATGVLPICVGKATKLIEYLSDDKEYVAVVQFGKNTDTYDLEGEITETFDKIVSEQEISNALYSFEGELSQVPPIYSAIKINGKKLYDYARKGESIEIKPRNVHIYSIKLLDFDKNLQQAKIRVACSKGTYIRSIAYDLGKLLGCGGYLCALERTKAGDFCLENALNLDEVQEKDTALSYLINPLDVMNNTVHNLSESEKDKVLHGMAINNNCYKNSNIVFLVYSGKIYGIGMVTENKILVKKVFEVL